MAPATVAILGSGPSGLAACKAALEEGLVPTVFEKASSVGGLWRSDATGKVWKSLRTNLSKYTCSFSDSPWPDSSPEFPSSAEVEEYLTRFACQHSLLQYIETSCEVNLIQSTEDGSWNVTWSNNSEQAATHPAKSLSRIFTHVIVATGIFAKPKVSAAFLSHSFTGTVIHAASYRDPEPFRAQRVLVVGAAFSGADIASEVSTVAASVTVAAQRPIWYLPRHLSGRPLDLVFYSRASSDKSKGLTEDQRNAQRHSFFSSVVGTVPSSIKVPDPSLSQLNYVSITDSFLESVQSGKVTVHTSGVQSISRQTVTFEDGHNQDFDCLIVATGYQVDLHFFEDSCLQAVEFDQNDLLLPVILHEHVWHPKLKNLGFVGLYRGPYFATIELQARWVCGVFSGRLSAPTTHELEEGLNSARRIRQQFPRPQFPYSSYVDMTDFVAKQVGVYPHQILGDTSNPLHILLYNGPLLPYHYRLTGFKADAQIAEAAIKACASKHYPGLLDTL